MLRQLLINSTGNPPEPPGGEPLEAEFTSFAPRVSLDYQYAEGSMVYVLFSRGYRPGGFNAILQGSPQQVLDQFAQFGASVAYEEERLDNFEAGMKSTWLDGRLQTRLAVYFDPYRNGQNQITIPFTNPDGTLNLASVFVNTGEADLQGFELEFDAAPTENLTISGSLGLADSEVKNFVCGDGVNVRGDNNCDGSQLPSASKWTWTLSADYEDELTGNYNWFARVDYAHFGKYYVDYTNEAWGRTAGPRQPEVGSPFRRPDSGGLRHQPVPGRHPAQRGDRQRPFHRGEVQRNPLLSGEKADLRAARHL